MFCWAICSTCGSIWQDVLLPSPVKFLLLYTAEEIFKQLTQPAFSVKEAQKGQRSMHLEMTLNSCWLCVPGLNSSVISNIQSSHSHACMYATPLQSCPTLCDPVDSSPPGSSAHGDSPRQGYWSGLPCPPPGDLPNPGIKSGSLMSTALAGGFFVTSTTNGKASPPQQSQPSQSLPPAHLWSPHLETRRQSRMIRTFAQESH